MLAGYRPLDLFLLVIVMILWGMNFAAVKIGLLQFPPLLFMALRFGLVAILLVPFVAPPRGYYKEVFAISTTLGLLHFAFMFHGLTVLDAATAAITIQLQVPISAALAWILFKDKLGWRRAGGMAVAFAGVGWIAGEPRLEEQFGALGLVLLGALMWAVANAQIKSLGNINGATLNAWVALFAVPQLALASLIVEEGQWQAILDADLTGWFTIVYQALGVVVIGYGLWFWLLKRYDLNQVMPITLLVPPIGVMSGVLFLNESLTVTFLGGSALTLIGVAIIVIRRPKALAPGSPR
ncbi:MAG: EamA family transporter [Pseudomonadota bacterium]